ncbi:hypothetical protein LMH87_009698 [Akanthomyces muscarius]|uniref:Uncharacterized protein n=2 Tax=Akanthomyces muscarius TaxID=2231603 RepID=A0A9W8QF92_AKAMU|nr:hypothetical protein LMH87_009698 [Akanthomyces muscarius]KAJ4153199.1 hypothetical protein LMH87_009698 [Akanthomyces muscarius]
MPYDCALSCVQRGTANEKPALMHTPSSLLMSKKQCQVLAAREGGNSTRTEDAHMQRDAHRQRPQLPQLHHAACSVWLHNMDVENPVRPTAAPTKTALVNMALVQSSRPITPTSRHHEKKNGVGALSNNSRTENTARLPSPSLPLVRHRRPPTTHLAIPQPVALLC